MQSTSLPQIGVKELVPLPQFQKRRCKLGRELARPSSLAVNEGRHLLLYGLTRKSNIVGKDTSKWNRKTRLPAGPSWF